jgi:hypothetical protein
MIKDINWLIEELEKKHNQYNGSDGAENFNGCKEEAYFYCLTLAKHVQSRECATNCDACICRECINPDGYISNKIWKRRAEIAERALRKCANAYAQFYCYGRTEEYKVHSEEMQEEFLQKAKKEIEKEEKKK